MCIRQGRESQFIMFLCVHIQCIFPSNSYLCRILCCLHTVHEESVWPLLSVMTCLSANERLQCCYVVDLHSVATCTNNTDKLEFFRPTYYTHTYMYIHTCTCSEDPSGGGRSIHDPGSDCHVCVPHPLLPLLPLGSVCGGRHHLLHLQ